MSDRRPSPDSRVQNDLDKRLNRLQSCWRHCDVGDLQLVTILECRRQNKDLGDIFWMLVPETNVKRKTVLLTKMAKTVTNM